MYILRESILRMRARMLKAEATDMSASHVCIAYIQRRTQRKCVLLARSWKDSPDIMSGSQSFRTMFRDLIVDIVRTVPQTLRTQRGRSDNTRDFASRNIYIYICKLQILFFARRSGALAFASRVTRRSSERDRSIPRLIRSRARQRLIDTSTCKKEKKKCRGMEKRWREREVTEAT